jgi:pilus assembly protein Flp/PilA
MMGTKGAAAVKTRLFSSLIRFLKRDDGPTAVEYAVMLSLVCVVCLASVTALGKNASTTYIQVSSKLSGS